MILLICLLIIISCLVETKSRLMTILREWCKGKIVRRCYTNWWTTFAITLDLKITISGSNSNLIWFDRSKIFTNTKIFLTLWQHYSIQIIVLRTSEVCSRIGELHLLMLKNKRKLRQRFQQLILILLTKDRHRKPCNNNRPNRKHKRSNRLLMKLQLVRCQLTLTSWPIRALKSS